MPQKITRKGLERNLGEWVEVFAKDTSKISGKLVKERIPSDTQEYRLDKVGYALSRGLETGDVMRVRIDQNLPIGNVGYARDYVVEL